jgi:ATP-dependent Clp protease ATP-binding subunit ClpC
MPKCERCNQNEARVRLDAINNGKREQHYLCRQCAEDLMGGQLGNASGEPGAEGPLGGLFGGMNGLGGQGGLFGFQPNASAVNGANGAKGAANNGNGNATGPRDAKNKQSKTPTLDQFGRDLTDEARAGKLDPAAGRAREIRRVITVLGRRQKNNPVLIGEPGVGKTAIVEGIAKRIAEGSVPAPLQGKRIVSLAMGGMVAGAMFRGQFEERIKSVLEEVRQAQDVILFIDELHTVVGAGAAEGAVGAADLLKPALARGEVRCIGATTLDEYRKHIEKDAALERRFQPVRVDEPSVEEAIAMLHLVKPNYESHHGVQVSDAAIEASVKLADRYINDRFLPDKAIDVMDEAASALRLEALEQGVITPDREAELEREIASVQTEKESAALTEQYERAASLRQREMQLQAQLEETRGHTGEAQPLVVTPELVARVVEQWTGVPVSQMVESERANLIHLEDDLRQRVIGQDEAISAVARAIRRSRAGLKDPKRPIGSFLFLGPTGVGKTELARALAATLFGGEDAMIRLDMSEYMEPHTVSRLFGSPPGYVGHDEGGQLTEQVRRRPYSVILLDEVEKAHPEVFNALLQIMDDGRLTDGQGRTVDFKNTVVIMTSNAGSSDLRRAARIGFVPGAAAAEGEADTKERDRAHAEMRSQALEGLRRMFRPEFLNRIDQTVVFHALGRGELTQIVDLLLAQVRGRLEEQGIALEIGDDVRDYLMAEGFDAEFGARPLRRAIQMHVDDALADAILAGELHSGQIAKLAMADGAVRVEAADRVAQPAPEPAPQAA